MGNMIVEGKINLIVTMGLRAKWIQMRPARLINIRMAAKVHFGKEIIIIRI